MFTFLVVTMTALQGVIPQMPVDSESTRTIISAIVMFIVVTLTAIKQYYSVEIRNGAIWPTLIVALVAVLGGANDLINVVPVNETMGQWLRFGITTMSMILAVSSKSLWPTTESKEVERVKEQLAP